MIGGNGQISSIRQGTSRGELVSGWLSIPSLTSSTDVAVGDGIGRFKELLSLIPNREQKEFFVEFEVEEAELNLAKKSYQYLRSLNF